MPAKIVCSFIFTFVLFLIFPSSVNGQKNNNGLLQVEPAYLDIVLNRGEKNKTFNLVYTNYSNKTISLEIFPIDFRQQNETGAIGFLKQSSQSYSYSLSSFLTFEANNLIIEPYEKKAFRISISDREDLSPGGHYAAVVARLSSDNKDKSTVAPAISSLIFMRKRGGERFNLSIRDLDWPTLPIVFSIPNSTNLIFQNEGNIHLIPYGKVEILDLFGRQIYKGTLNISSAIVFPQTRRIIPITFIKTSNLMPLSVLSLRIKGSDSLKKTSYLLQETFIYINPIIIFFLLFIIMIFILSKKRTQRMH